MKIAYGGALYSMSQYIQNLDDAKTFCKGLKVNDGIENILKSINIFEKIKLINVHTYKRVSTEYVWANATWCFSMTISLLFLRITDGIFGLFYV